MSIQRYEMDTYWPRTNSYTTAIGWQIDIGRLSIVIAWHVDERVKLGGK